MRKNPTRANTFKAGFKYPNYIFEGSEHVHHSEITFQNYTGSVPVFLDPLFRVRWEGLGTRLVRDIIVGKGYIPLSKGNECARSMQCRELK